LRNGVKGFEILLFNHPEKFVNCIELEPWETKPPGELSDDALLEAGMFFWRNQHDLSCQCIYGT
jgi:hypothetical protein